MSPAAIIVALGIAFGHASAQEIAPAATPQSADSGDSDAPPHQRSAAGIEGPERLADPEFAVEVTDMLVCYLAQ